MVKSTQFAAGTLVLAAATAFAAAIPAATATGEVATSADFTGEYAYTYSGGSNGTPFATTWSVTPCGDGCVHIKTASGLTDTNAYRDGGFWVFERYDEAGVRCDNNTLVPARVRFKVDPSALVGELQPLGSPCGGASRTTSFTLTKLA